MEEEAAGEVGLIESVSLSNIMCHRNLKLEFGPFINFIVGPNGSGKSAIVTAIMLALGSKTSSTGRSMNVRNVIMKGEQTAEVSITLKNAGKRAYKPEIFGSSITIERKIKLDGSSYYKLKNANGSVVSSKKEELNEVLAAFNVQPDNPIAILTQEVSKTFLNSRNSRDKYELFYRATQLQFVEEKYQNAIKNRIVAETMLHTKEEESGNLKQEIENLEKQINNNRALDAQKDYLQKLYEEFSWSLVAENETFLYELVLRTDKTMAEIEENKKKLNEIGIKYGKALERENNRQQAYSKLEDIRITMNLLAKQRKDLKLKIRQKKSMIQKLNSDINIQEIFIASLKSHTENAQEEAQRYEEQKKLECKQKVAQLLAKKEDLKNRLQILQKEQSAEKESMGKIKTEYITKVEQLETLECKISVTEAEISEIKQCQANHLFVYGSNMPQLLAKIKEAAGRGCFHHTPLGPIGLYVKVQDPQWEFAVEICLGSKLLNSFLCDNNDDRNELFEIMKEFYPKQTPQVISSPFKNAIYNVSSGQVKSTKYQNVLDMLVINNPNILNCLIDYRGIETILLIPSSLEAREAMLYNPPPKCTEAYTLKGVCFFPVPSFRQYANKRKTASLISPTRLDESLKLKTEEMEKLKEAQNTYKDNIESLNSQITRHNNYIQEILNKITHFEHEIFLMDNEINEVNEGMSQMVTLCPDELEKAKVCLINLKKCENEESKVLEALTKELKNTESEEVVHQETQQEILDTLSETFALVCYENAASLLEEKNRLEKSNKEIYVKLQAEQEAHEKQIHTVEEVIVRAEEVCPRIQTERKSITLDKLIIETRTMISALENTDRSPAEVYETCIQKKQQYHTVLGEMEHLKVIIQKHQRVTDKRLVAFRDIRTYTGMTVSHLFNANLFTRGHVGMLKMDHIKKQMDLSLRMGNVTCYHTLHSGTLSGGEKSFLTVALLLALWDAVEIPFRILDEYDVYMDQMNRKHSMDMMVKSAMEHSSNQFIFLSPLELVAKYRSDRVQILELPSP